MNKKNIITILIAVVIGILLLLVNNTSKLYEKANNFYEVYLNGENIGLISDKDALYKLIDKNQVAIKYQYNVDTVYPPTDLKIVGTNTFNANLDNINNVYDKIEEADDFTVKGYVITVKNSESEYKINVLDKELFYNAAKRFVRAFLDENEYEKYINNTQEEIVNTGRIIENMKFEEDISIKEDYISVNDKIFTDELELSQFLLFGSNPERKVYEVKLGDTIKSVSEANKLNVEEFLIANTKYKSENTLLRVGDKVDVTLIDPQLTFVYDLFEIADVIEYYQKKTVQDNTKPTTYKEITTRGQNGVNRITEKYSVTNGERAQGVETIETKVIREVVNQVTTVGTKSNNPYIPPDPVDISGDWGWPTNKGYVITSRWGWRWGKMHQGLDISGAGNRNSPIYAVQDGTVIYVYNGCPTSGKGYGDSCGGGMGNQVLIEHANGYYTRYAHLAQNVRVKVGQTVSRGEQIGGMGNSGSSTGYHLHFAVAKGSQTSYFNPMLLYGGDL